VKSNPRRSKCRAAAQALDEALSLEPWHFTRTSEAESIAVKELPRAEEARGQWLQELVDHQRLIQRPIITAQDGTTVIGRDNSLAKVLASSS